MPWKDVKEIQYTMCFLSSTPDLCLNIRTLSLDVLCTFSAVLSAQPTPHKSKEEGDSVGGCVFVCFLDSFHDCLSFISLPCFDSIWQLSKGLKSQDSVMLALRSYWLLSFIITVYSLFNIMLKMPWRLETNRIFLCRVKYLLNNLKNTVANVGCLI